MARTSHNECRLDVPTGGLAIISQPKTKCARSGDVSIAYQVVGDGPTDLVYVPGFISHVELAWEMPPVVHVSGTVKDLVAGSGIAFTERGEHVLKGVPETWRLFAVDR